jgi:hypothetical protein
MKKILMVAVFLLLSCVSALSAVAAVKLGGIIFTDFYYLNRDKENAQFSRVGNGTNSYNVTTIQLPNISRLHGRWTNEDNVGMYIEIGIGQTSGDIDLNTSNGVELRHAYGWWDINDRVQVLAGKTTTPFSPLNPSQLLGTRSGSLNIVGVGYGNYYSGRFAQVRGTFHFCKNARLAVALVDPNGSARYVGEYGPWAEWQIDVQNNTRVPRIDMGLPIYAGPVSIYPSFMYQHRTVDIPDNPGVENKLDTYMGSLGFKVGFGPFSFSGEGNWGKNWGNTRGVESGNSMPALLSTAMLDTTTMKINNAETYSFWLDMSYKIGPITPHLIYGQMKTKNAFQGAETEARSQMWGVSVPIDLAKGFKIRPEFMWYDDGDLNIEGVEPFGLGKYTIYGVQFQITF